MKTTRSGRLRLPKTLPTTIRLILSVHVHHVCCDIEVNFLILLSVLCLCVIFQFCCFKTEIFFSSILLCSGLSRSLGWNFRDATVGLKALQFSLLRNSKQVTEAIVSWHLLVANSLESFLFRGGSFFNFECPLHRNAIVSLSNILPNYIQFMQPHFKIKNNSIGKNLIFLCEKPNGQTKFTFFFRR